MTRILFTQDMHDRLARDEDVCDALGEYEVGKTYDLLSLPDHHLAKVIECLPDVVAPYLEALSRDERWLVREAAARHKDAGPYLETLSRDAHWYVRAAVARHKDAGPYLETLSRDADWCVREAVARHPDAGPYLQALSQDADWCVRAGVARHPDAGLHLDALSRDSSELVRETAKARLKANRSSDLTWRAQGDGLEPRQSRAEALSDYSQRYPDDSSLQLVAYSGSTIVQVNWYRLENGVCHFVRGRWLQTQDSLEFWTTDLHANELRHRSPEAALAEETGPQCPLFMFRQRVKPHASALRDFAKPLTTLLYHLDHTLGLSDGNNTVKTKPMQELQLKFIAGILEEYKVRGYELLEERAYVRRADGEWLESGKRVKHG